MWHYVVFSSALILGTTSCRIGTGAGKCNELREAEPFFNNGNVFRYSVIPYSVI